MRKHFVLLLVLVLCIGLLSGCSAKETTAPHTHEDLTIRLPLDYLDLSEKPYATEYNFLYGLDPITVCGLRDEKVLFEDHDLHLTLETYGQLVLQTNGLDSNLTQTEGFWCFTYEAVGYTFVATLRETEEAFWTVQAYCPTEKYDKASDQMWEILKSVTV